MHWSLMSKFSDSAQFEPRKSSTCVTTCARAHANTHANTHASTHANTHSKHTTFTLLPFPKPLLLPFSKNKKNNHAETQFPIKPCPSSLPPPFHTKMRPLPLQATIYCPMEARAKPAPDIQITRGHRIRDCFWSFSAHAEAKGFEFKRNGYSAEIQNPYRSNTSKWRSATKWRSTGVYSRCWFVLDCGYVRGYALQFYCLESLRITRTFI